MLITITARSVIISLEFATCRGCWGYCTQDCTLVCGCGRGLSAVGIYPFERFVHKIIDRVKWSVIVVDDLCVNCAGFLVHNYVKLKSFTDRKKQPRDCPPSTHGEVLVSVRILFIVGIVWHSKTEDRRSSSTNTTCSWGCS